MLYISERELRTRWPVYQYNRFIFFIRTKQVRVRGVYYFSLHICISIIIIETGYFFFPTKTFQDILSTVLIFHWYKLYRLYSCYYISTFSSHISLFFQLFSLVSYTLNYISSCEDYGRCSLQHPGIFGIQLIDSVYVFLTVIQSIVVF